MRYNDGVTGKTADDEWQRCTTRIPILLGTPFASQSFCSGIEVPGTSHCYLHLNPEQREDFLAALQPGSPLDLRGTSLSPDSLIPLLDRLTKEPGVPVVGPCRFDHATFAANVLFGGVHFEGPVSFDGATFNGVAGFAGMSFSSASFRGTEFQANANFVGTVFRGPADFSSSTVEGHAMFTRTSFEAGAAFAGMQVKGEAQFQNAVFHGGTGFGCEFHGAAIFQDAEFSDLTSFGGTAFNGPALFQNAQFTSAALFGNSVFRGTTSFDDGRFETAQYDLSQFHGHVSFSGVVSTQEITFRNAMFAGTTQIGPMVATAGAKFDRATFQTAPVIDVSSQRVSLDHARFEQGGTIRLGGGQATTENAVFAQPATMASTSEHVGAIVRIRATKTRLQPQLISVRGMDAANLAISGLDLSQCLFADALRLDQLRMQGNIQFAPAPRKPSLRRPWALLRSARETIAEEQHWRASRTKHADWAQHREHPLSASGLIPIREPAQIAATYRALRKSHEDAKNEPGAADFYYGEMEMRRYAHNTRWPERIIITLYWLAAGYGLRAMRSIWSLAASVAFAALLLEYTGFTHHFHPGYLDTLIYSMQSILALSLQNGHIAQAALTRPGQVIHMALRVIGPGLIAMALLSVRNRIKR